MKKHERVVRHGPFKGKRITFASTERIEALKGIAEEFMSRVFELDPGDYVISDESDLRDFVSFIEEDAGDAWNRMQKMYGISRESMASTRLIDVFEELANRQRPRQ